MRMRWTVGGVLAAAVLVAGCGVSGGAARPSAEADRGGADATAGSPTKPLDAQGALERLRPSIALISTPESTGSAVLLEDGYLLTDAHVVDPFHEVDVTFAGGERIEGVRVVQVDLVADLALVGTVEVDAPPVELAEPPGDADEGRAFLVGFPGDQDVDDPEPRVTEGDLDGLVPDDRWGLSYVRSTTPIRDGQSGGALVDERGRVIGISGLSDDDGTALSVAGGDVLESVESLLGYDGSRWQGLDLDDAATSFTERPVYDRAAESYYVPPGDEEQRITVTVDGPAPQVAVSAVGESDVPWAVSSSIDPDDGDDAWFVDDADELEAAGDGAWAIDLEAGETAIITVAVAAGVEEYGVEVSVPVVPVVTVGPTFGVVIGSPRRFVLDSIDDVAWAPVELEAGVTYEIAARTPSGDASWYIEQGEDPDDAADADDGGGGIFDLDAVGTFTPSRGGTYDLLVYEYAEGPTEVEVEVRLAG